MEQMKQCSNCGTFRSVDKRYCNMCGSQNCVGDGYGYGIGCMNQTQQYSQHHQQIPTEGCVQPAQQGNVRPVAPAGAQYPYAQYPYVQNQYLQNQNPQYTYAQYSNYYAMTAKVPRKQGKFEVLVRALCYPLMYLGIQLLVSLFYGFYLGFKVILSQDESAIEDLVNNISTELLALFINLLFIGVLVGISLLRKRNPITDFGIKPFSPRYIVPSILLGIAANVVLSVLISVIPWPSFMADSFESTYSDVGTGNLLLSILSVSIVTGITEETVFRGALMSRMSRAYKAPISIAVSAMVFGLFHVTAIAIIYSSILAVLLGAMTYRSDSIVPAIITHIFFNFTALMLGYVTSESLLIGITLVSVSVLFFAIWLFFKRTPVREDDQTEKETTEEIQNEAL